MICTYHPGGLPCTAEATVVMGVECPHCGERFNGELCEEHRLYVERWFPSHGSCGVCDYAGGVLLSEPVLL